MGLGGCPVGVQRYTGRPLFTLNKYITIHFGSTGTPAFHLCHQASFHLKFARKYPLLALKLLENHVDFKTESSKKERKETLWYNF